MKNYLFLLFFFSFLYGFPVDNSFFSDPNNRTLVFLKTSNPEGEYQTGKPFLDSLLQIQTFSLDEFMIHAARSWYARNGNTDESSDAIIQAKSILSDHPELVDYQGFLFLAEAKAYRYFGQLDKSNMYLDLAEQEFSSRQDQAMLCIVKNQINMNLAEADELQLAIQNSQNLINQIRPIETISSELQPLIELYTWSHYTTILTIASNRIKSDLDLTEKSLIETINMAKGLGQGLIESNAKGNLAYIFMLNQHYPEALELARVDLAYSEKGDRMASTAHLYYLIARIHFGLNQMDSTAYYIKKTENFLEYFSEPKLLNEFSELSFQYYSKTNNASGAFQSMQKQQVYLKNLYYKKSKTDFELLKAEKDLENATINLQEMQEKNKVQKQMGTLLILMLAILSGMLFYIVKQHSTLKEQNKRLEVLNNSLEQEVNKRTKKIAEQNLKIREIAFRNSHQTRAPVAKLLGMIELLNVNDEDDQSVIIDKIRDSAKEIDEVLFEINQILTKNDSE